jgi:hypothetical protein
VTHAILTGVVWSCLVTFGRAWSPRPGVTAAQSDRLEPNLKFRWEQLSTEAGARSAALVGCRCSADQQSRRNSALPRIIVPQQDLEDLGLAFVATRVGHLRSPLAFSVVMVSTEIAKLFELERLGLNLICRSICNVEDIFHRETPACLRPMTDPNTTRNANTV